MENLIVEVSKYLMIILFACYAYECFSAFRSRISTEKRNHIFDRQIFLMYLIHLDAFLVLYTVTDEINLIILYFLQVILVTIVIVNYQLLYPKASRLVTNNMHAAFNGRLYYADKAFSYGKAIRQYAIAICASVITIVIPVLIRKVVLTKTDLALCDDRHCRTCLRLPYLVPRAMVRRSRLRSVACFRYSHLNL